MSAASARGNGTDVHPDGGRRAYRGVSAAGGVGEADGCVATAANRVQSLRRGFYGLIRRWPGDDPLADPSSGSLPRRLL